MGHAKPSSSRSLQSASYTGAGGGAVATVEVVVGAVVVANVVVVGTVVGTTVVVGLITPAHR